MNVQDTVLDGLRRKYPTLAKKAERGPTKAIRLFCLDCMGGSPGDVKACGSTRCPLHPFRLGTRAKGVVGDRFGVAHAAEGGEGVVQVPPNEDGAETR